jgi:hypothetical protein
MNDAAPTATVPTPHPVVSSRRTERRVAVSLLAGVGAFELALAAGAPWGAAAWGGQSPGVLPTSLRVASAAAVLVYGGLAVLVATDRVGWMWRARLLTAASLLIALGTVGNLASQSPVERVWAPVAATLAVMLWRLRGPRSR